MDEGDIQRIKDEVDQVVKEHIEASRVHYNRLLDNAKDRDEKLLSVVQEQNEALTLISQNLKILSDAIKKDRQDTLARFEKIIYALLSLIVGILAAIGLHRGGTL